MKVALLVLLPTVRGLMFASTAVKKQWDTWGFVENGTWFAPFPIQRHDSYSHSRKHSQPTLPVPRDAGMRTT